jgi:hypothetical protein
VKKEIDIANPDKKQIIQNPSHMLGMFLVNGYPDQFWEGYAKACVLLGVNVPKRPA